MSNAVSPIPEGYRTVTPYLTVSNVERQLEFIKNAFGGEETFKMPRPDGSIGHAEARIGDSMVMLGGAQEAAQARPGTIYLYVPEVDAVYKRAMAAGGKSIREPTTEFYGDRCGAVEDPLGNRWWIATHVEDVSAEDMQLRSSKKA